MTPCEHLRESLEAAVAGELAVDLRQHLETCADCQSTVRRARQSGEGGAMLRPLRAPAELKARLKAMTRLPASCEQAVERFGAALRGELNASEQTELLAHLRACRACQGSWEALATLREVGSLTRIADPARAALSVHPRLRITVRRQYRTFDLRLATAAAYLLAALTVLLIGNPTQIARAGNVPIERAAIYTRAVVENRFESYVRKVRENTTDARIWASETAASAWTALQGLIGGQPENPQPSGDVVPDGNGGRS